MPLWGFIVMPSGECLRDYALEGFFISVFWHSECNKINFTFLFLVITKLGCPYQKLHSENYEALTSIFPAKLVGAGTGCPSGKRA